MGHISGIGAAIAIQLAKRGANVVINYTSDRSRARAEQVLSTVTAQGVKGSLCQASVTDISQLQKLVDAALSLSQTGKIEILVHKSVLPPSRVFSTTMGGTDQVCHCCIAAVLLLGKMQT